MLTSFISQLYRLLISLKLAVLLIIAIMAVLATGTIIESFYGAAAAKILVYNSLWFSPLIVLLALNVLAVALSRLPWKKKHLGFVMTHCGILLLLAGALVSRYYMIDGQVAIAQESTESFITLPQPIVQIQSPDKGKIWAYRVPQKAFQWEGHESFEEGRGPFSLNMLNFYPKAEVVERYVSAHEGPAALHVRLYNQMIDQDEWLVKEDPHHSSMEMGPARILVAEELLEEDSKAGSIEESALKFQIGELTVSVPVKEDLQFPAILPLEGTPYEVTLLQVFRHGVVAGGKLIDHAETTGSDVWVNPAVKLRLEGEGIVEDHTVFAKFPDFPTIHGQAPKPSGVKVCFHVPGVEEAQAADCELRFVPGEKGILRVQLKRNGKLETMEVAEGEEIETGWMDLKLQVEEYFPKAQKEEVFIPLSNTSDLEGAVSAIQLEIGDGEEKADVWLQQGKHEMVTIGGQQYLVAYSLKRIPLGFKLKLVNFIRTDYPGTHNPASFSSDVILSDAMQGVTKEAHISMNEPLDYRGFKIYQSGYLQGPGEPDVSIFAVSRDPGIWLTYAGSIVMILGIIAMIVLKKQVRT